uniref:Envelope glycoprotein n=1 Tax=Gongylonema pulchrum TaxID=637853 RepID=A0A183E6V0_9BILA
LLLDGIARARAVCKLKYLTGGAVVACGLPIVTHVPDCIAEVEEECEVQLVDDTFTGSPVKYYKTRNRAYTSCRGLIEHSSGFVLYRFSQRSEKRSYLRTGAMGATCKVM